MLSHPWTRLQIKRFEQSALFDNKNIIKKTGKREFVIIASGGIQMVIFSIWIGFNGWRSVHAYNMLCSMPQQIVNCLENLYIWTLKINQKRICSSRHKKFDCFRFTMNEILCNQLPSYALSLLLLFYILRNNTFLREAWKLFWHSLKISRSSNIYQMFLKQQPEEKTSLTKLKLKNIKTLTT